MKKEIDTRLAVGAVVVILVIFGIVAFLKFGSGGGGVQTAADAGMGKPMHAGDRPGTPMGAGVPNLNNNVPTKK